MIKNLLGCACIILPFVAGEVQSQIQQVSRVTEVIQQYEKAEWKITLQAEWTDPYQASEVALDMEILSPAGKKLVLPCFYFSGASQQASIWKARFTPRATGKYHYTFTLRNHGKVINVTPAAEFNSAASNKKGFLRHNNNWSFKFDNGELFRGIGENIGWESRTQDDSRYFKALHENPKFNYRDMLTKLVANGGNFFRTWMIYWNLPVDWKTVQNSNRYQNSQVRFNESGIRRLDELINLCDSLGIYLMLALESHAGYIGSGWELNNYHLKNGGLAATPLEFFTSEKARARYQDKLRFLIARWGYSPAITVWEFFNEIDNVMFASGPQNRIPDDVITDWHREMSAYLKQHDPYQHLITTSISHRDVKGLNDLASIDINQKHIYKHTSSIPATIDQYLHQHHKPYVIGEFSYEWDWQKNFNDFAAEMARDFKSGLWYGLFSPTPILPLTWWWEYFDAQGLTPYFQRVQEIHKQMLTAGKGDYRPIMVNVSSQEIKALGVQCGEKYFVYLYNSHQNNMRTDLQLEVNNLGGLVDYYDCETGSYHKLQEVGPDPHKFILTDFKMAGKADVVLIFSKLNR